MAALGRPSDRDERRAAAWREWLQRRNPFAIASLVLGIFSLIEFGVLLVFGIGGIATGLIALAQLRRQRLQADADPLPAAGRGLAVAGIALSATSLAMAALLYLRAFG